MTEKIEEVENPEDETTVETPEQNKTFTQKDLDKVVTLRLQRERAASKKIQDDLTAEAESLKSTIESYEKLFKTFVEEKKKEIPENFHGLLDKLSLLEQYEFLTDPKNKMAEKKQIPTTPKSEGNPEGETRKFRKFI